MRTPSEIREIANNPATSPEDRAAARRLLYTGRMFEEHFREPPVDDFRAPEPPHVLLPAPGCRMAVPRGVAWLVPG